MKKFFIFVFFVLFATTAQAAKPVKVEPTIDNYLQPNPGITVLSNVGWFTNINDPAQPRDHQYFITGETGEAYLDTAEDFEVNGSSVVTPINPTYNKNGKLLKTDGGLINDFDQYTGNAVVVLKGKTKEAPVDVYEARADITGPNGNIELPGAGNGCAPWQVYVKADFVHPGTFEDKSYFEKVNSLLFINQYRDGEPAEELAFLVDDNTTRIGACADRGYTVQVDGDRSIQDAYTGLTIGLDHDSWTVDLPPIAPTLVGVDLDLDGVADIVDENPADNVMDSTIAAIPGFGDEYQLIVAPAYNGVFNNSTLLKTSKFIR